MFLLEKVIVLSAFLVTYGNTQWHGKKVMMEIHFEWLCGDSERFIESLDSHWDSLAPYVDVKFVPFGKATSLPDGRFVCQHGPMECKGNRFMSCALRRIPDQTAQVRFLGCIMRNNKKSVSNFLYSFSNDGDIQNCAAQAGLDFADTMRCFQSPEGTQLQLQAEIATKRGYKLPDFVPTIIYDNHFDQSLQDNSVANIKDAVCQVLEEKSITKCLNRRSYEYYDESQSFEDPYWRS